MQRLRQAFSWSGQTSFGPSASTLELAPVPPPWSMQLSYSELQVFSQLADTPVAGADAVAP